MPYHVFRWRLQTDVQGPQNPNWHTPVVNQIDRYVDFMNAVQFNYARADKAGGGFILRIYFTVPVTKKLDYRVMIKLIPQQNVGNNTQFRDAHGSG